LDLILGLPLHPLIIHAVVVLVPLSALGVIFLLVFPRIAPTFSPLILILLIASTVLALLQKTQVKLYRIVLAIRGIMASRVSAYLS